MQIYYIKDEKVCLMFIVHTYFVGKIRIRNVIGIVHIYLTEKIQIQHSLVFLLPFQISYIKDRHTIKDLYTRSFYLKNTE